MTQGQQRLLASARSKPHKYRAKPTIVDGIRFASQKEATRYNELKLLEKGGEIRELELQVPFVLHAGNDEQSSIGRYIADFVYRVRVGTRWRYRVEDVKGFKTPLYRWKKRHVEVEYCIQIHEV